MASTSHRGSSAAYRVLWHETLRAVTQAGKIPAAELPSLESNEALIAEFEHARAGHAAYDSTSTTPADTVLALYRKYLTEKKAMAQSVMQILVDENKQLRDRVKQLEAIIAKNGIEPLLAGDADVVARSRRSSVEVSMDGVLKHVNETASSLTRSSSSSSRRISRQSSLELSHSAALPPTPEHGSIAENRTEPTNENGADPEEELASTGARPRRSSFGRNSQIMQFAAF